MRSVTTVEGVLEARVTIELFDYGADVEVDIPPESAVGAVRTVANEDELLDIGQQLAAAAPSSQSSP
jgi:hypothetical protein